MSEKANLIPYPATLPVFGLGKSLHPIAAIVPREQWSRKAQLDGESARLYQDEKEKCHFGTRLRAKIPYQVASLWVVLKPHQGE